MFLKSLSLSISLWTYTHTRSFPPGQTKLVLREFLTMRGNTSEAHGLWSQEPLTDMSFCTDTDNTVYAGYLSKHRNTLTHSSWGQWGQTHARLSENTAHYFNHSLSRGTETKSVSQRMQQLLNIGTYGSSLAEGLFPWILPIPHPFYMVSLSLLGTIIYNFH